MQESLETVSKQESGPGEGYRWLVEHEIVLATDETPEDDGTWTSPIRIGKVVTRDFAHLYRRRA